MRSVVVLFSGAGTNLDALAASLARPDSPGRITLAIGNRAATPGFAVARAHGIPSRLTSHVDRSRADFETELVAAVAQAAPDLVVLAGFDRILGPVWLDAFGDRTLNLHPSLLPAFPGRNAVRQAFDAGVRITGVTVHEVDAGVDTGPILAQEPVRVFPGDDLQTLQRRVHGVEHRLLPAVVRTWLSRGPG